MVDRFEGCMVVADLETTDKEIETAGICQLAALSITQHTNMSWKIQPLLQTYCNPREPMREGALAVHGITPDLYKYAPTDTKAMWVFRTLIESLGPSPILCGYNSTRYDYPLMDNCSAPGYITCDTCDLAGEPRPQIDVMTLFLRTEPEKGLKLTEVYEDKFGSDDLMTSAHDALADITMTARLLEWFLKRYPTDPHVLAEWCGTPTQLEVMPWGKHKGQRFDSIPRGYLQWMADKWTDMHPDLACTLQNMGVLK